MKVGGVLRQERNWDPVFTEYMEFIASHPTYESMPYRFRADGSIRWVVTRKSEIGQARLIWWEQQAKHRQIPTSGKWRARTARELHPTRVKPCQVCGRELRLDYVYPTKPATRELLKIARGSLDETSVRFNPIGETIRSLADHLGVQAFEELARIFKIPDSVKREVNAFAQFIVQECQSQLSPGAMSNCPDRFDGFHTYNLCCRELEDTGRHKENLSRYGEDRRAYEHWADGDWKVASHLMKRTREGSCSVCGQWRRLTADHIGPISLGFAHRPRFRTLCRSCNSARNNRMSYADVRQLLADEANGDDVVSWHARPLWNKLKHHVHNDADAERLSRVMRWNHHIVLEMLYAIAHAGYRDFLYTFLNPEFAFQQDIEFVHLNEDTLQYSYVRTRPGTRQEHLNNAARYVRIAFESLEEYHTKENRNWSVPEFVEQRISALLRILSRWSGHDPALRQLLNHAFEPGCTDSDKVLRAVVARWKKPDLPRCEQAEDALIKIIEAVSHELCEHYLNEH